MDLHTRYELGQGWLLFARINNLFGQGYASGGALAENLFDANGNFATNSADLRRETFTAPAESDSITTSPGAETYVPRLGDQPVALHRNFCRWHIEIAAEIVDPPP